MKKVRKSEKNTLFCIGKLVFTSFGHIFYHLSEKSVPGGPYEACLVK